ncbi:MAG: dihydroorotate dehydrogenase electron transfer subunit [bacterium]
MPLTSARRSVLDLSVLSNQQVFPGTFLLTFEGGPLSESVRPGQFVMLSLPGRLDPLLPRPYAVYDVEGSRAQVLYKRVGKGTRLLSLLRPGDPFRILGPLGNGFLLPEPAAPCLILAGGMGFASVHLLARRARAAGCRTRLLYGARTGQEIPPLAALESRGVDVRVATEDGKVGFHGRVTDLLRRTLEAPGEPLPSATLAFVCGPPSMLRQAAGMLEEAGIEGQFSLEARMACGYGVCQGCVTRAKRTGESQQAAYRKVCAEGPVFRTDEIDWEAY